MKLFLKILVVIVIISTIYILGPAPSKPNFSNILPKVSSDISTLGELIQQKESKIKYIKHNNQARIIWADSIDKQKTEYCIVYLHGFTASQQEGNPVHLDFAKKYGCNLYLARLYEHGLNKEEALLNITPEKLMTSANYAVAIGKQLGKKVILMSTSTGGTLSLYIAAHHPEIAALILYSPNIDLYDNNSFILTKPWGLQIARQIVGSDYMVTEGNDSVKNYWTTKYRLEALVSLKSLISSAMTIETFSAVKQPVFVGYYYKNATQQDDVVSIPRILEMYNQLGTPETKKRKIAFSTVGHHCIGNVFKSKDIAEVERETFRFAEDILKMKPIEK